MACSHIAAGSVEKITELSDHSVETIYFGAKNEAFD